MEDDKTVGYTAILKGGFKMLPEDVAVTGTGEILIWNYDTDTNTQGSWTTAPDGTKLIELKE